MKFAQLEKKYNELWKERVRCREEIKPFVSKTQASQHLDYFALTKLSELFIEYCALSFTMLNHLKTNKTKFEDPENVERYLNNNINAIKEDLNGLSVLYGSLDEKAKFFIVDLLNRLDTPAYEPSVVSLNDMQGTFFQRVEEIKQEIEEIEQSNSASRLHLFRF
ncbi:hypothetical protein ACQUW5_12665 [Legionella sp. CNM-1927-20]|uniref:hypothetical protein n=1 Tax=Legionella sp. CNM-1927-20 TaxID=3422221 RepID=UPI00403A9D7C